MRRRSIYDLELRLNDYGKEIFVEAACEKTDKPLIWYHVDNRGMINRWVRRGGIEGARLGPAPYIEVGGWQRDLNGWLKLVGEKWELPIIRSLAAGQKPMDAITTATSATANALGLGDHLGVIAPGYDADIIAVRGDPAADIHALNSVVFVMRGGVVFK